MPTRGEAFSFLGLRGPEILRGPVGSMLYVGHRPDTSPWWRNTFAPLIGAYRLAVLDINPEMLKSVSGIDTHVGDVRTPDLSGFVVVFSDDGPDHVPQLDVAPCLDRLLERNGSVLVSCPWGFQRQGSDPTDPEFHHWGPRPEDLRTMGLNVISFGSSFDDGIEGGNLIGWRRRC